MNALTPTRGRRLVKAERVFAHGGLIARLVAGGFHRLLDRIDAGLEQGSMEALLPDGETRMFGGRGPGPKVVIHLVSWRALARLGSAGSVGWYRAWVKGEWTSPDPVALFDLFMRNGRTLGRAARARGLARLLNITLHALRRNSPRGARKNIAYHYDLGNDFYRLWLDDNLHYSSALFRDTTESLEVAQSRKGRAILDRLALQRDAHLLEIGCGWGALAEQALASGPLRYTGITLSKEQRAFAIARLARFGDHAEIALVDYRDATGSFDAVASVEMVEAVGARYWPDYLAAIHRLLKPGGRAAIQYICIDDALYEGYAASVDFIQAYIFPGGMLLSESRFRALAEAQGFAWEDVHHFGQDYAETLRQWRARFDAAVEAGKLPCDFDAAFVNLWRYYLMYCEGGFRGGGIDVAQVTLVKV